MLQSNYFEKWSCFCGFGMPNFKPCIVKKSWNVQLHVTIYHIHFQGIHCDNDIQKRAFELAIKQACDAEEHCNLKILTTGTQQQVSRVCNSCELSIS